MTGNQRAEEEVPVRDPAVYSNVSVQRYDAIDEEKWTHHLTWRELAEEREKELATMRKWAGICADLDRCEHGRHEGDVCDGCKGYSHGNLITGHGVIGHGIETGHIFVPERAVRNDPDAWRVKNGRCRDPEQAGTPCPINPIPTPTTSTPEHNDESSAGGVGFLYCKRCGNVLPCREDRPHAAHWVIGGHGGVRWCVGNPTPTTSAETTTKSDFISSKSAPSAERVAALEAVAEAAKGLDPNALSYFYSRGYGADPLDPLRAALATLDEHA